MQVAVSSILDIDPNASVDFSLILVVIYFSLAGAGLGTLSGLFPGIHVNTLALLLTALYPSLESLLLPLILSMSIDPLMLPVLISSMIVAAAVVHSFVDFVPSIFLGAPDEESIFSMLPGHRLLLSGKGMVAVHCAAQGSLLGALISLILCVPLCWTLGPPLSLFESLDALIPLVLILSVAVLILHEKGGELRAEIDARKGMVTLSRPCLSIKYQVPVDGQEVELVGRIEKGLLHHSIRNGSRSYPLKGKNLQPSAFVNVKGVWRVKRKSGRGRLSAVSVILISGTLGFTVLNATLPLSNTWVGLNQSILFPLLTGLFGIPTLLLASAGHDIPKQQLDAENEIDLVSAAKGVASGGIVGWFPGITATTGTVLGSIGLKRRKKDTTKQFITMVSSVGTSSTVFSLLALALADKGRSGAMLAVREVLTQRSVDLSFPSQAFSLLILSVLVASVLGYVLTIKMGLVFARRFSGANLSRLNQGIIALLLSLVAVFTGFPGLLVLGAATVTGLIPSRLGISRVHLSGCLLVPLLWYFIGPELTQLFG